MVLRKIFILFINVSFIYRVVYSLTCLSCDSITQPRHCHFVARCKSDEVCGAEKLSTTTGYFSYKLSCVSKAEPYWPDQPVIFGSLDTLSANDIWLKYEASSVYYPATRGPICYDCPFHTSQQPCRRIEFCSIDEDCSIRGADEFGDISFSSGCTRKHLCPDLADTTPPPLVGKRSLVSERSAVRPVCESCCFQDLCNLNCSTTDLCTTSSCKHGNCVTTNSTSTCSCSPGWKGPRCDHADRCSPSPCGLGTCHPTASSFVCSCHSGWSGPRCDVSTFGCDFETSLCTWTQSTTDNFDWTRNSGTTGSTGTGPNNDHTHPSRTGYYMFIEASSPRSTGDKADLVSETLRPGETYCMELAINMHGATMGSIDIYIKPERKTMFLIQHFKQINDTVDWSVHNITIPTQPHPFNIVIEGVRGRDYYSDAAIDDISLKPGPC